MGKKKTTHDKAFDAMVSATSKTSIQDVISKVKEAHVSKDERLENFNEWYKKYGRGGQQRGRRASKRKRDADYRALKTVWEESGSPLISSEAYTEEYGKKFPGRAHATRKPFYFGRTNFGSDSIHNIKSYDDLFAELAHTYEGKDKGIIGRFIQSKRTRFERDDPSRERQKSGDMGMYDKKTIDFPEWTEKLGLKDIWSLETKAHGTGPQFKGEGGVGREKILEDQYKASYLRAVKKEIEKKRK